MDDQDLYDEDEKAKIVKIVIVGQSGVGKTNVILRYVEDKFNVVSNTTIGIQFTQKTLRINNKRIVIQIWDTAGQERFRALNKNFYNNALGAIILFDLTNRDSFNAVERWLSELKEYVAQYTVFLLVGNKSDLKNRIVTVNEVTNYAKQRGMGYIQTSAVTGTNINKAFQLLTAKVTQNIDSIKQSYKKQKTHKSSYKLSKSHVQPYEASKKKKKGCC